MNAAIIGYGYWGPNLARNISYLEDVKLHTIVDLNPERLQKAQKSYPAVTMSTKIADIFDNKDIDIVAIATPVSTHYPLAREALLKGKHVLIEKPITDSYAHAKELIALAKAQKKVLMVDHTFLYTSAVQKIKQLIDNKEVGEVQYFDSTRINLGLFQSDINVIWDLAPHDLSILRYLVPQDPESIVATGISHTSTGHENIAYITVYYPHNMIAHFNCSWTSPVKIRQVLIGGTKKMILYDDLEPTNKIKIYDTTYNVETSSEKLRVEYRVGDILIPMVSAGEALSAMVKDFVAAVKTGSDTISSSDISLFVIRILEAAQKSIKNNGERIVL